MALTFHKVLTLPGTPAADAVYFVDNGSLSTLYVTDQAGVAHKVTPDIQHYIEVADITARDALSASEFFLALVLDASADATVTSGAALYSYNPTGPVWTKVAEFESMDVSGTSDWTTNDW